MSAVGHYLIWMLAASVLLLGGVRQAEAEFIITFSQVGANVLADGSGTLNLSALSFQGLGGAAGAVFPASGEVLLGSSPTVQLADVYTGASGPSPYAIGPGPGGFASTGSGLPVGVIGNIGEIWVPEGYISGDSISSSASWDNTTISGFGLTPGTYTWTWGSVAAGTAESFVVEVPSATVVPEPASLTLLGIGSAGLLGIAWRSRRGRKRLADSREPVM